MNSNPSQMPVVYLRPGEWYSGRKRVLVKTILGSCVAVTMFHRRSGLAAVCHALMPLCEEGKGCGSYCETSSKFADCIIQRMAETFFQKGIQAADIEVKLFGGADSLGTTAGSRGSLCVGHRNIEQARKSIEKERLSLRISDVGGSKGRKIFFNADTGEVLLKRLTETQIPQVQMEA